MLAENRFAGINKFLKTATPFKQKDLDPPQLCDYCGQFLF